MSLRNIQRWRNTRALSNSDVLESSMINNVVGIVIAFDMNGVYCRLRLYAIDK